MSQMGETYYGGGGYLSQGGNQSPGFGGSPGGKNRSDASHALRPLTINQIKQASQAHSDAEWVLDGHEIGQIVLIGTVMAVKRQTTNVSYSIADGTSKIEARQWIDSSMAEAEGVGNDDALMHQYVCVHGSLKMFGSQRYINATNVRKATPYQFYHWLLETMVIKLTLERGPPPRPGQAPQSRPPGIGGNASSAYAAQSAPQQTQSGMVQFAKCSPLQKKIAHYLLNQSSDDGTHVSLIAQHVGGDPMEISAALEGLLEDGHVYTTVDDEHFLISR
ncbi:hypothetical protein BDV98DRAFT_552046 [Pterulicium gracile]|uniref:Replication protein A C-terminal domain-containing protein n=1 Tax=Pterulicium gracile TaxID=1884261 RepID=A0A5C3QB02_9AGAR|nr:hypothetical protein BDV98DRAFT_552046 [Pterula gracilis]